VNGPKIHLVAGVRLFPLFFFEPLGNLPPLRLVLNALQEIAVVADVFPSDETLH
jgi:hypothetical protein